MSADVTKRLQLQQVDEALSLWREARLPRTPPTGWMVTIRTALRLSAAVVGRRAGIGERAMRKLESAERDGAITLKTLRRIAEALDCELQYALVPRRPLDGMLLDRAIQVAEARLAPTAQTMRLEGQGLDPKRHGQLVKLLAETLVQSGRRF